MTEQYSIGRTEVAQLRDALLDAQAFFEHRDEMNAFVHGSPTRPSHITLKVGAAAELASGIAAQLIEVSR